MFAIPTIDVKLRLYSGIQPSSGTPHSGSGIGKLIMSPPNVITLDLSHCSTRNRGFANDARSNIVVSPNLYLPVVHLANHNFKIVDIISIALITPLNDG